MGATCTICTKQQIDKVPQPVSPINLAKFSTQQIQHDFTNPSLMPANNSGQAQQVYQRKRTRRTSSIIGGAPPDFFKEANNAIVTDIVKSQAECEFIFNSLKSSFIFQALGQEQLNHVIQQMKHYSLAPGEIVVSQGSPGVNFFIVISGRLEVLINNERKGLLKSGQGFGEIALLHDTVRMATVKTVERVNLWGVDRKTFRSAVDSMNQQSYIENRSFIDHVPVFNNLSDQQKDLLMSQVTTQIYLQNQIIVNQGDPGELLYIIKEGEVNCFKGEQLLRVMRRGDYFGEQALLYNEVRSATVKANTGVKCLSIKRSNLQKVLGDDLPIIIYKNIIKMSLENSSVLKRLEDKQKQVLVESMEIFSFGEDSTIIQAGDSVTIGFYVVLRGAVQGTESKILLEKLSCIGDQYLIGNSQGIYDEDFIAIEDTDVAFINKQQFENAIGGPLDNVSRLNETLVALKKVPLLRELSPQQINQLVHAAIVKEYKKDQIIVEQGDDGDSLFIIKSGKVDILINGNLVRTITQHNYFGERSLLQNQTRSATCKANDYFVECWMITKDDFIQITGEAQRNYLLKRIDMQDINIDLEQMLPLEFVGKGVYGNVISVLNPTKKNVYALKAITRDKAAAYDLYESLPIERSILLSLDHPMILKLYRTYKDSQRIYFLTEYVNGTDLLDAMRVLGICSDQDAKIYLACLLIIFEHLHDRDILYRDVKPENILIDEDGFPKLVDFGSAKIIKGRTFTIVGTPHYMAPEIILGKGYSHSADIWSMGVILYELLSGQLPFADDEDDQYAVYEAVLKQKLKFVQPIRKSAARSLIKQMLNKQPGLRAKGGIEKMKQHKFCQDLNWDQILGRNIRMPFIPEQKNLEQRIIDVQRNRVTIFDMLSSIEANNPIPDNRVIIQEPPLNWDYEF